MLRSIVQEVNSASDLAEALDIIVERVQDGLLVFLVIKAKVGRILVIQYLPRIVVQHPTIIIPRRVVVARSNRGMVAGSDFYIGFDGNKAHGTIKCSRLSVRLPSAFRREVMTLPVRLRVEENEAALDAALDKIAGLAGG